MKLGGPFGRARREGESVSTVQSLSGKFLSLLRDHSRLKRESSHKCQAKEASAAREDCHRNFWRSWDTEYCVQN